VIYLVTDVGEHHGPMNLGPVIRNLTARGIRVFVVLLVAALAKQNPADGGLTL
jgi:hypothetical protein